MGAMKMTPDLRRIADCFAGLVNLTFDDQPGVDRRGYDRIVRRLRPALMALEPRVTRKAAGEPITDFLEIPNAPQTEWEEWSPYYFDGLLGVFQEHMAQSIRDLTEGKPTHIQYKATLLLTDRYKLRESLSCAVSARLDAVLFRILNIQPFPFRKCGECPAIFVRSGRQLYCSTVCAGKSADRRRAGTRNEYMRDYMRDRREREQKKKREKGRGRRAKPS